MTEPCEYCQRWSGIYIAGNRCCLVRQLAGAPKLARQARYAQEREEKGVEAMEQLKAEVAAEYQRKAVFDAARGKK